MRENRLIIICVTIIVCVALVCGTIFLTHNNNQENNTNNSTNNNTTVNSTINYTNTTNDTTTTETSSSKSSGKKSSSSSDKFNGEKVKDKRYNDFGEEIITTDKNVYVRNPENGKYKNYYDVNRGD